MEKTDVQSLTYSTANKRFKSRNTTRLKFVDKLSKLDRLRFDGLEESVKNLNIGSYRSYILSCQDYLAFITERLDKHFGR